MKEHKRKMQEVSFRHIGELLDYLPEDQLAITERLREMILECLPQVREKLTYNAPFYALRRNICFIWPGAVPWGSKTREGVDLGFNYGHLLQDESGYLEQGHRKQVFTKTFFRLEDIDEDLIRQLLFESAEVDELLFRERSTNKKNKRRRPG